MSIVSPGKIKNLIISCLLFSGLWACLTPVDFKVDPSDELIVINGQVSSISERNMVQVSRTTNAQTRPTTVLDAEVMLTDDVGNSYRYVYLLDSLNPDTYFLPDFKGVPGRVYTITVTLPSGKKVKSNPERMPESVPIDSVYYTLPVREKLDGEGSSLDDHFLEIYANTKIPERSTPRYLKWSVEETFLLSPTDLPDIFGRIPLACYVNQVPDGNRITLISNVETATLSTDIKNILICSRVVDWTFLERHYFHVYQSSITPEAYHYWSKVNVLANQVGSIFDKPPAFIEGNIESVTNPGERVLGYFQATNESYKRFFLLPSFLPFNFLPRNCLFTGSYYEYDYPDRCFECNLLRNSTHQRPHWF